MRTWRRGILGRVPRRSGETRIHRACLDAPVPGPDFKIAGPNANHHVGSRNGTRHDAHGLIRAA